MRSTSLAGTRVAVVFRTLVSVNLSSLLVAACSAPAAGPGTSAEQPLDVLIKGGRVVDGTGSPWFRADVGIAGGRIVAIGNLADRPAKTVIDAAGHFVTPGFIDMHTHSDLSLLKDGRGLSKILQGVTTEVIGEGGSVAPRRPEMDGGRGSYGIQPDWATLREYLDRLAASGTSGNVMSYIGAGQLRRYVIGEEHRKPTPEELEEMKRLLAQGMEDGAAGLVTALETPGQPDPGDSVAGTDELVELAKVVGGYGGMYASHIRDQGVRLVESIEEAATIGERAGVRVEVFHLKAAGRPYKGKMKEALAAIEAARRRGVDILANQYPYIAAAHGMTTEVPRWAHEGGRQKFLERLADPELRPRIKREVTAYMTGKYYNEPEGKTGFDALMVSSVPKTPERYVGKTIGQIAREQGKAPDDMVLDLLIEQDGDVGLVMFYMSEDDVRRGLQSPLVSVGSDGTAGSPEFGGQPHPRWYGTFARVLGHYARDLGTLRMEEAVRKMTSMPTQHMGILDRGIIREGMWADVVVFDPDRIIDRATFTQPHQYADGIDYVLVNGVVVADHGQHTGAFPGRPLYGPGRREVARAAQ
ncbi:MAG: D-aminoacylase [Gemmatimonadetes bacterium]|nr:D-aminoacylase [Gemmatimonadota bacterium]